MDKPHGKSGRYAYRSISVGNNLDNIREHGASIGFELTNTCDVCGKPRRIGNHERCSRIRQKRYAAERQKIKPV